MTFDFKILPTVLNDIINDDVEDLILLEYREIHKIYFKPTLDLIKQLKKTYYSDDFSKYSYVVYNISEDSEDDIAFFSDNEMIFLFEEVGDIDLSLYEDFDDILDIDDEYDFNDGFVIQDDDIDMF